MNHHGIAELNRSEIEEVAGGIPLVVAGYIAFYGAKAAYAAGVAVGAGLVTYAVFDD